MTLAGQTPICFPRRRRGSVVDAAGKIPLPDATVDLGGGMTTTDSNGQFVATSTRRATR
jgi:hypothetical protein